MTPIKSLPFGPGALAIMGGFIVVMLGVGLLAWKKRRENSLADFYLGGREMGLVVLAFTLYATQYSGNTLFGFSGGAYREGLRFLVSVHFMTAIVVAYLVFAPALYRQSRDRGFVTPGDFIEHRYANRGLRLLVTGLMLFALCNFTLAQMKTMGTAFAGLSNGGIPIETGVIGLALVMLVYESLGGMRSVAWTDVFQGGVLFVGFALLMILVLTQEAGLASAIETLASQPETQHKVNPPDAEGVRTWISFILIVGLGAAIYPQAIQRIYAARSSQVLKKSLAVMAFMPLFTALIAVIVGVIMAAKHPELGAAGASGLTERVLPLLCLEVMRSSELGYWAVAMIFSAILAAIMSTADSALLSISSMIAKDVYGTCIRPDATERQMTRVGKYSAWALMIPMVWIALEFKGTLIQLLELKFELLIQCVPVFYLGVHWKRLTGRTAIWGIAIGLATTLALSWSGTLGLAVENHSRVWGIHSGLIGLAANLLVCSLDALRARQAPGGNG